MSDPLRYSTQTIDESDIAAVVESLRTDWLTQGPQVDAFERAVAEYCGVDHAVAVCNGTAALHLVAEAIGLGPGDVSITTPITFLASAACARYAGADVDFCDVRADTITMDPECLDERLAAHKGAARMVVPVDFGGTPADLEAIYEIASARGAFVLEDACHALGAEYTVAGERVRTGSCRAADACVFSFHPVKHITTGEGGMITTNDAELASSLRRLRHHGMVRASELDLADADPDRDPWYYEVPRVGYNYRITDFQCALGLAQMRRVDHFIARRRAIAAAYDAAFADCDAIETPALLGDRSSSYHLYYIRLHANRSRATRRELFERLRDQDIHAQVHYVPVHRQPCFRAGDGAAIAMPVSEAYYARTLSIPCYPTMTESDVQRVVGAVRDIVEG